MGLPAARVGDTTSHGTPLGPGPGAATVLIGGKPAWRALADSHVCPLVDGTKPHAGGTVAVASATVKARFFKGRLIIRPVSHRSGGGSNK